MATRRRGVKHSYNKTRTIIKASLRKTRHKNKKNKHRKTKKRYQSGGVPKKERAKGEKGVPTEYKVLRKFIATRKLSPGLAAKQANWHKSNNTAEFDLDMGVTGLPYHISVKSVKRKTPGQNVFTIMCGKSDRFFTQVGIGKVPYHMVVVIREKHPTEPNKIQNRALQIDLRAPGGRSLLFGNANDCKIIEIVERAQRLSDAYCENDEDAQNNTKIAEFNNELKQLGAKIQLAPKKGNPAKKRYTRAQASITGFNPNSPRSQASILDQYNLSSETSSEPSSGLNSANIDSKPVVGQVELASHNPNPNPNPMPEPGSMARARSRSRSRSRAENETSERARTPKSSGRKKTIHETIHELKKEKEEKMRQRGIDNQKRLERLSNRQQVQSFAPSSPASQFPGSFPASSAASFAPSFPASFAPSSAASFPASFTPSFPASFAPSFPASSAASQLPE